MRCATQPLTGLIAFGLFLPLIGFKTVQNIRNELVLETRWPLLLASWSPSSPACAFCKRWSSHPGCSAAPRGRGNRRRRRRLARAVARWFTPFALGFVVVYPLLALALAGRRAPLKWIDNFGIQILIYVMLGWGLNIVVGLAGLLDLGYVAFYAVGAYSYALLAQDISACRSGCCCRSPASSPRSGASCSAFRCCGCAATISPSSRSPSARSSAWC